MTEQSDRNESRIMKLEIRMEDMIKDCEKLEKEVESIATKIDKAIYILLAILALSNPLTAEMTQKYFKSAFHESNQPAQARERVK